jgi:hypothetical protein
LFAFLVVHGRHLVILAWVIGALAVWHYAPNLNQLPLTTINSLVPKNLPALRIESQASASARTCCRGWSWSSTSAQASAPLANGASSPRRPPSIKGGSRASPRALWPSPT